MPDRRPFVCDCCNRHLTCLLRWEESPIPLCVTCHINGCEHIPFHPPRRQLRLFS